MIGTGIYTLLIIVHYCSSQSHPILCGPLDCSLLGSSVHEIFQARNTGVGCHFLLQAIFLTQGLNLCLLCLLHCRQILYPLVHWGSHTLLLSNYYKLLEITGKSNCFHIVSLGFFFFFSFLILLLPALAKNIRYIFLPIQIPILLSYTSLPSG